MPEKKGRRSTRARTYERRRRTRRQQQSHRQQGGSRSELREWLGRAHAAFRTAGPPSGSVTFKDYQQEGLQLKSGSGPSTEEYSPPYLGDIMTNIATRLSERGARIENSAAFVAAMEILEREDKGAFNAFVDLETYLQKEHSGTDSAGAVSLLTVSPSAPLFLWIAYANLPEKLGDTLPVLGSVQKLQEPVTPTPPA